MPIKILSRDRESLSVEYTDASGVTHSLPELLGSFESDLDAELSAIEQASDLMSREEMRELTAKAYKRDEMRQRAKQRWAGTTPEQRKAHSDAMNAKRKKQGC